MNPLMKLTKNELLSKVTKKEYDINYLLVRKYKLILSGECRVVVHGLQEEVLFENTLLRKRDLVFHLIFLNHTFDKLMESFNRIVDKMTRNNTINTVHRINFYMSWDKEFYEYFLLNDKLPRTVHDERNECELMRQEESDAWFINDIMP